MANVIELARNCLLIISSVVIVHVLIYDQFVEGSTIKINRAIIKTIKGDNEIIDCFDIYKQPAFDHPLLRNHKIQMSPSSSYHNNEMKAEESKFELIQPWQKYGRCPEGTVPIRRSRKQFSRRPPSFSRKRRQNHPRQNQTFPALPVDRTSHECAIVITEGTKFKGAQAKINIWKPQIGAQHEISVSQIWVIAGQDNDHSVNTVEAGWIVNGDLYGDYETRFFIYWTSNDYQSTGCYDVTCPGFVQRSTQFALGSTITPVSSSAGPQYDAAFSIFMDPETGNWWVQVQGEHVGYWPSAIFNSLAGGATQVEFGGEIVNLQSQGHHTTTHMGSGQFPSLGYGEASYFRNLQIIDETNSWKIPENLTPVITNRNCYDLHIEDQTPTYGSNFYYGGFGYSSLNCP